MTDEELADQRERAEMFVGVTSMVVGFVILGIAIDTGAALAYGVGAVSLVAGAVTFFASPMAAALSARRAKRLAKAEVMRRAKAMPKARARYLKP